MNLAECIKTNFYESMKIKDVVAKELSATIMEAGQILAQCLRDGGKILSCGNGGSACDAEHFTTEIANRFQLERDGLAAVTLNADVAVMTAIANDYGYQNVFSRQIKALGKSGDVLLVISTSGNSQNIIQAIHKAHECGMKVIALTGNDGGMMMNDLDSNDIILCVPSKITPRIQEVHILIIHCLCELVDRLLFSRVC